MSPQSIRTRAARQTDVDAICVLWREFMECHAAHDSYFAIEVGSEKYFAQHLREHISNRMACVRVAIRDGVICGYIMGKIENRPPVFVRKRAGMIGDLAVAADYRRLGIGRLLADDIFKWFKSHDIDRVELILLSANPLSTQFWQALGFEAYSCRMFREI